MNQGALRALEFDRVVAALSSFALTPLGAAKLAGTMPDVDAGRVRRAQEATEETVRYLEGQPTFPLRASETLAEVLELLGVEGRALEPLRLVDLTSFLESIDYAVGAVRRAPGTFPVLSSIIARAASFEAETRDVRRRVDQSGDLFDHASPALQGIRDRLRRQRSRLRESLEAFLRGRDTAKYLQEQVITDRNGRSVILLKAEHKGAIPGIVHGSSASGATLFLEPLATVEVNNEIVALQEEEAEEVHRILLELTDRFRQRRPDVDATTGVATDLDALQARARLAQAMDAVRPDVTTDGRLELRGARHPLLMRSVVARYSSDTAALPEAPVPVDIVVDPPNTALVITGPNTGGKTVALKTSGLLALMAQSGLQVPARHAVLPVFRGVFADIGDEQSIAASLSTFSWHIRNIAEMDRHLNPPALVLLDEIGAGTDPVEGGALGIAIVEHFRARGALVIGTTHYDVLKSYASTTAGVITAAFGFEPDGFRPTYRLVYGTPGRSLALEIAARLGLRSEIVTAARQHVSAREAQLQDHLSRVDQDLRALQQDRAALERDQRAFAAAQQEFKAREAALHEREAEIRRRLNDRIEARVREARREIDDVVEDLKKRTSVLMNRVSRQASAPRLNTGQTGAARAQAQAAIEEVADRLRREVDGSPSSELAIEARPARVGDRVMVGGFGIEGTVLSIVDRHAEVDVRGKRMRAKVADLRVVSRPETKAAPVQTVRVNVNIEPRDGLLSEINVIGCTVDEALTRTERFLDETLISDVRSVRVVHGHGTGQLRRAISGFLKDHPLVAGFHPAPPEQGGGGVTVVELKE